MGTSLLPSHLLRGRLLQGGLLPVPCHIRGAHPAIQREGAGGGPAPLLAPHGSVPVQQRGEEQLPGLSGDPGGQREHHQAAHQAAEDDGPRRSAQEASEDELHHLRDELQPWRTAHEAAAHQLCPRRLRRQAQWQGQDCHGAYEQVSGGFTPQTPATGRGRSGQDGRALASQTQKDEFRSIHVKLATYF